MLEGEDFKNILNVTQNSDNDKDRELVDQYKSMGALLEDGEKIQTAEQYKAMLDEKAKAAATVGQGTANATPAKTDSSAAASEQEQLSSWEKVMKGLDDKLGDVMA